MSLETGSFWRWGWGCRVALQPLCMCGEPQARPWLWEHQKGLCSWYPSPVERLQAILIPDLDFQSLSRNLPGGTALLHLCSLCDYSPGAFAGSGPAWSVLFSLPEVSTLDVQSHPRLLADFTPPAPQAWYRTPSLERWLRPSEELDGIGRTGSGTFQLFSEFWLWLMIGISDSQKLWLLAQEPFLFLLCLFKFFFSELSPRLFSSPALLSLLPHLTLLLPLSSGS